MNPPYTLTGSLAAPSSLAILPSLVTSRLSRPTRKHGPLRLEQLFHPRVLASLASFLQSLASPLSLHPSIFCHTRTKYVSYAIGIHVRGALA